MRYELPKSYSKRMTTPPSTPSPYSQHPSRSRNLAELRSRLAQTPPTTTPTAATTSAGAPIMPASPSQSSTSKPQPGADATVTASTYRQLLGELQSRNRENEHLKQVTQRLLSEMSDLQAKYAQAMSSIPPSRHSESSITPADPFAASPSHISDVKPASPQEARANPSSPASSPASNRQAIGHALTKLSFLERLRHPNRTDSQPKSSNQPQANNPPQAIGGASPAQTANASSLPQLSVLNQLRQAKQSNSNGVGAAQLSRNARMSEEGATARGKIVSSIPPASPSATAGMAPPLAAPESLQPELSERPNQATETGIQSSASPNLSSLPLIHEIADEDYTSPYQKARQEQAQTTPLWMWLVAWLLLLPISAGLGYTFVQWVMNPGAPASAPPPIEQTE